MYIYNIYIYIHSARREEDAAHAQCVVAHRLQGEGGAAVNAADNRQITSLVLRLRKGACGCGANSAGGRGGGSVGPEVESRTPNQTKAHAQRVVADRLQGEGGGGSGFERPRRDDGTDVCQRARARGCCASAAGGRGGGRKTGPID